MMKTYEELIDYLKADFETRYQIHKAAYFKLYPESTIEKFYRFEAAYLKRQINKYEKREIVEPLDTEIYISQIEVLEYINKISSNKAPQPININESRTKKIISETISNIDKQGWEYAFFSEYDYNLFAEVLTNFFEDKPYKLPETPIQLKRTCKTKLAKALGEIHKELSNEDKLSTDNNYFQIIRTLNHFEKVKKGDLYKALTR